MRPRRARCIVAPGCGRAWRGGTCTFTAWRWRGARRARPRRARCIVAPGCGRAWRGGTCTFTVWRWRGARRARGARGACGAAVSGVARRWAACAGADAAAQGEVHHCVQQRPRTARRYVHWHTNVAMQKRVHSATPWRCARRGARWCVGADAPMRQCMWRERMHLHTRRRGSMPAGSVGLWRGGGQARAVA